MLKVLYLQKKCTFNIHQICLILFIFTFIKLHLKRSIVSLLEIKGNQVFKVFKHNYLNKVKTKTKTYKLF